MSISLTAFEIIKQEGRFYIFISSQELLTNFVACLAHVFYIIYKRASQVTIYDWKSSNNKANLSELLDYFLTCSFFTLSL
jgi:hypothetical protein